MKGVRFERLELRIQLSGPSDFPVLLDINPTGDAIWANQPSGHYPIPQNGVLFNGKSFFVATDGQHGSELWVTDGSATGTHMVVDLAGGSESSDPSGLLVHGNALYFVARGSTGGPAVFKTDGTAVGTVRLTPTTN